MSEAGPCIKLLGLFINGPSGNPLISITLEVNWRGVDLVAGKRCRQPTGKRPYISPLLSPTRLSINFEASDPFVCIAFKVDGGRIDLHVLQGLL